MTITQTEFEALPKEEQNLRLALFVKSNGYAKDLSTETVDAFKAKYLDRKEKLDPKLFN